MQRSKSIKTKKDLKEGRSGQNCSGEIRRTEFFYASSFFLKPTVSFHMAVIYICDYTNNKLKEKWLIERVIREMGNRKALLKKWLLTTHVSSEMIALLSKEMHDRRRVREPTRDIREESSCGRLLLSSAASWEPLGKKLLGLFLPCLQAPCPFLFAWTKKEGRCLRLITWAERAIHWKQGSKVWPPHAVAEPWGPDTVSTRVRPQGCSRSHTHMSEAKEKPLSVYKRQDAEVLIYLIEASGQTERCCWWWERWQASSLSSAVSEGKEAFERRATETELHMLLYVPELQGTTSFLTGCCVMKPLTEKNRVTGQRLPGGRASQFLFAQ